MGETFLIHVNCSKILLGSEETHYTMFVDTAKISIVYELVEWIRWIFSVENCVYLIHDSSVIHELEDIKLLSKLRNLEVKPCGQPQCIHKKIYRTLLSSFNLFVSWNKIKVHKYFFDKINQMNQNMIQKSQPNDHSIIFSNSEIHEELMDCNNFKSESDKEKLMENKLLSDNQYSNSFMDHSPPAKKRDLTSSSRSITKEKEKLALKTSSGFEEEIKPNSNLSYYEESDKFSNFLDNSESHNLTSNSKKEIISKTSNNKSECVQMTNKNFSKSGINKNSDRHIRPFSVGEILSNLRKDSTCETYPINTSVAQKNSDEELKTVSNFLINVENTVKPKKRQRTRRKRSRNQTLENEMFISPSVESDDINRNFNYSKSHGSLRPNHIRFDLDDGDHLMCTEFVNDINEQREIEDEMIQEKIKHCGFPKSDKSVPVTNNYHQSLLDSQNSSLINSQSKVECTPINSDQIQKEEKLIDLDDQSCVITKDPCCATGNDHLESFNPDLNMILSLKAKCTNAVVIQRF